MRILFVLNGFLPNSIGGTEVYVSKLSIKLKNQGLTVEVIVPNIGSSEFQEYYHSGIKIIRYPETTKVDRRLILGFSRSSGLNYFKKLLHENKYDIIHFHEIAGSNGITLNHVKIAKQICKVVLYTFHLANLTCNNSTLVRYNGTMCDGLITQKDCTSCFYRKQIPSARLSVLLSFISNFIYRLKLNSLSINHKFATAVSGAQVIARMKESLKDLVMTVSHFVVLTDWYKQILLLNEVPQNKITKIQQGVTNEFIEQDNSAVYHTEQKLKLLFIGRISHFKGLHLLIDAVEGINSNLIELTIYGKPDNTQYAEKLKERSKNRINIIWGGVIENEKILDVMNKHHLLCLCSTFSEMSPLVIQEAFAAKLPILASDVVGNKEQVKDNINGYLFNMNDSDSLRRKLEYCIKNPQDLLRMKNIYTSLRTFDEIAKDHIVLYNQLLQEPLKN